jgi:hypothetical protein
MSFPFNRFPMIGATNRRSGSPTFPGLGRSVQRIAYRSGASTYLVTYQYCGASDCSVSAPNPSAAPPTRLDTA